MPDDNSSVPKAPPVADFYEFLGGGKPKPVAAKPKDDLTDLLDAANDDLAFDPEKDTIFNSSQNELDLS